MSYPTGTYAKNGHRRVVETQADAVAALFDGFTHVPEEEAPTEPNNAPTSTSATPDKPSGSPVDRTDRSRSFS